MQSTFFSPVEWMSPAWLESRQFINRIFWPFFPVRRLYLDGCAESQIKATLKHANTGVPVKDICRQAEISVHYSQWLNKYGGLKASELQRVMELIAELQRMYAELSLDYVARKQQTHRNHKRIDRVYKANKLHLKCAARKRLPKGERIAVSVTAHPNHVWSVDFSSDALACGRYFRTFNVIDDFNLRVCASRSNLRSTQRGESACLSRSRANMACPRSFGRTIAQTFPVRHSNSGAMTIKWV